MTRGGRGVPDDGGVRVRRLGLTLEAKAGDVAANGHTIDAMLRALSAVSPFGVAGLFAVLVAACSPFEEKYAAEVGYHQGTSERGTSGVSSCR